MRAIARDQCIAAQSHCGGEHCTVFFRQPVYQFQFRPRCLCGAEAKALGQGLKRAYRIRLLDSQISARLDHNVIERLHASQRESLRRADHLFQSLLQSAFSYNS